MGGAGLWEHGCYDVSGAAAAQGMAERPCGAGSCQFCVFCCLKNKNQDYRVLFVLCFLLSLVFFCFLFFLVFFSIFGILSILLSLGLLFFPCVFFFGVTLG
jgi:hypothetical protein